jgi:signal transduction histidine kinase
LKAPHTFATRLTLLATALTGLVVVVVSAAHIALAVGRVRTLALESVAAQARVIAANSTAALDFDDAAAARATLMGLATVREFAAAEITKLGGPSGSAFAVYERGGGEHLHELRAVRPAGIEGPWLTFVQPIVRDGEHIGDLRLLYDFRPLRRRLMNQIVINIVIGLAAVGLSFLAARRIQRSLLRPVRELSHAAEAIASSDDFSIRARKVSNDELGALTDVFNSMIERIAEAEAIRRNHRQLLEEEVSRRTAEVLEAQARLRQSERMASLGTLSAGLGHDIGNLLMPLRSHLASIRDRVGATDEDHDDFAAIGRAMEYLQNLSASLRLFAHEGAGTDLRRDPTPLAAWWERMEPLLRAMMGGGIVLEHDLPAELAPVKLSQSLLMQAVFNLVQNAAQALTPDGGVPLPGARIRVAAEALSSADGRPLVAISVADNGPGMTEEVRKRCLEPYFTTKTRRISSGLGLSLVKGIVESAEGELTIRSEPGAGATFTLTLPAAPGPAPARGVPAFVTLEDARRRAVVAHVLRAMHCEVRLGADAAEAADGKSEAIWVTDSLDVVPVEWPGRVVLMVGAPPPAGGAARDSMTVLDAAAPLPALRSTFRQLMSGA